MSGECHNEFTQQILASISRLSANARKPIDQSVARKGHEFRVPCKVCRARGGGTPYVMGDTYVPRFWPPFFTLAGSSTIFLGYFFSSTNTKTIFCGILTEFDLLGPKFNFSLDLFGSNFQRPAAHPHHFSDRVPPPRDVGYLGKAVVTGQSLMSRLQTYLPRNRTKALFCCGSG